MRSRPIIPVFLAFAAVQLQSDAHAGSRPASWLNVMVSHQKRPFIPSTWWGTGSDELGKTVAMPTEITAPWKCSVDREYSARHERFSAIYIVACSHPAGAEFDAFVGCDGPGDGTYTGVSHTLSNGSTIHLGLVCRIR
jgi:hypothetical protein